MDLREAYRLSLEADRYAIGDGVRMDPEWAAKLTLDAIEILERIKRKNELPFKYWFAGNCFLNAKKFNEALKYFKKSVETAESLRTNEFMDNSFGGIGKCYKELGDYENSIFFLSKAAEISLKNDDLQFYHSNMLDIGTCYEEKKDFESAVKTYLKALEKGKSIMSGLLELDTGLCYIKLKDLKKAAETFIKDAQNSLVDDSLSAGNSYFYAALCQIQMGDKEAKNNLKRSIIQYERIDNKFQYSSTFGLGRCYELLEEYENAKRLFKRSRELTEEKIKEIDNRASKQTVGSLKQMDKIENETNKGLLFKIDLFSLRTDAKISIKNVDFKSAVDKLDSVLLRLEQLIMTDYIKAIFEIDYEQTKKILEQTKKELKPKEKASAFEYFPRKR